MDAWNTLIAGSTIANGDAWEHLLAQGGGGDTTIILASGMEGVIVDQTVGVEIVMGEVAADISAPQLAGNIAAAPLDGSVDDAVTVATISSIIDGDII
jgi:hypothetical protein